MAQDVQQVTFGVNTYQSRSSILSSERVVNMYAENNPPEAPFRGASLFNTPGQKVWTDVEDYSPIFGSIVFGNFIYVVYGVNVYKIDGTKTHTFIGSLTTVPDYVQMTQNGTQITILTSSGRAFYIASDVLAEITDGNYQLSSSVTTLDGYSIFSVQNSNQFFISNINDTSTIPGDFATAQANPDNLVVILNYNRYLILLGQTSTEIWYDTGSNNFPFSRVDGGVIQKGCAAKYSAVVDITGFYWLGNDKIVYQSSSFTPVRISTFGIESIIEKFTVIDDAISFIYTQGGHKFLCITFPTEQKSIIYDISTGLWHERMSLNPQTFQEQNWSSTIHVYFNGKHLVNGVRNGILYELDLDVYSDDTVPMIAEVISCTQFKDFKRFMVDKFALIMDMGVGISQGQGSDPQIILSISIDGGKTWSKESIATLGGIGRYQTELYWSKLALCRNILFKIRISDPVKRSILGGYLNITEGLS